MLGGFFARGTDGGAPDEQPRAEVYVDTFFMDRYEVTNRDYARCIAAKICKRPRPFEGYLEPKQPIVAVSWFDAVAFCKMNGKRLPTEAEFERAASGIEGTQFSWGNEASGCDAAIIETRRGKGCGAGTTWPVGSRPAGHFGLFDISGNVWEWVSDWYSPCYGSCENACGDGVQRRKSAGTLQRRARVPQITLCAACAAAPGGTRSNARERPRAGVRSRRTRVRTGSVFGARRDLEPAG